MNGRILLNLLILSFCQASFAQTDTLCVYFAFNQSVPIQSSGESLQKFIREWEQNMELIGLVGHTDTVGSTDYNLQLSARRIEYVRSVLSEITKKEPLKVSPMGERFAHQVPGKDAGASRRVDIIYRRKTVLPEVIRKTPESAAPVTPRKKAPSMEEQLEHFVNQSDSDEHLNIDLQIHFFGGEATMLPESGDVMNELLRVLKEYPELTIRIHGHVCCGPEPRLALERAKTVYQFLIDNKIAPDRMEYLGHSNLQPRVWPEKNEKDRIANRRVTIEFMK